VSVMYASTSQDASSRAMKTAPRTAALAKGRFLPILLLALGAVFIAVPVHADITPQTDPFAVVRTGDSNVSWYMGTSTSNATLSSVGLWLAEPTAVGSSVYIRITCFANTYSTSQSGCTDSSAHQSAAVSVFSTTGQSYFFTYTSPVALQSGKVYLMEIVSVSPYVSVYGTTSYQFAGQCDYAALGSVDCTGTPYFTTNSIPDWSGLNATSTALTALYQSGASSTLGIIQARCTGTGGGVFGEAVCAAFSFLFIPNPSILNGYASMPAEMGNHFPVSYVAGVAAAFNSLNASSTANMITVSLPFHSIAIGTSSPLGLSNLVSADVDAFSTSTIEHYIGTSNWALFQSLIALAIWLTLASDIFFTVRNQMHKV